MPSILSRLWSQRPEAKHTPGGPMLALQALGLARWTQRDGAVLTREGYERNAVVYRCVRMVAEAAASIPWVAFEGRDERPDHPALALLARPNPADVGPGLLEALFSNLLLFGNAYVEAVCVEERVREIYALRPDRVSVVPGANGWPAAYDYTVGAQRRRYFLARDGLAPILHLKMFHPLDDHYGFAPISAAQVALDIHNAAGFWNKALLDNAARPSGALVYSGPAGATLSDDQFDRLKAELDENFSGGRNAGRPLLLEGGLDWKALSLTPKDMDFIEAKAGAAREIALAFGVPPLLLGLPGDNTYANYAEASRAFWRQTVIPLVARTQKSFSSWLEPAFGRFTLDYDVDRIEALAEERAAEWTRIGAADFLSVDEKRAAVGYGAGSTRKDAGRASDRKFDPNQPRVSAGQAGGGQWTNADASIETEYSASVTRIQDIHPVQFTDDDLGKTVQSFVSENCLGKINRELPGQYMCSTLADVLADAPLGIQPANKCIKLLQQKRFRKP